MNKYIYDGPVLLFGKLIAERWHAETMAVSKKKAKRNLIFQFQYETGRSPTTKIELPNELMVVNMEGWYDSERH